MIQGQILELQLIESGEREMNQFEEKSKKSYDSKAEKYEATFDGKFTVKFKKELVKKVNIQDGNNVLDVACGNGRLLQMFSKTADFHGFGIDISENMIRCAREMNPTMNFQVAGCDKAPFEKEKMDIVTVCAAFHHFPNINDFAGEMYRIMKQDGIIYIAEVYLPQPLRTICNPFVKFSKAGDVKFYAPNEIIDCFSKVGFERDHVGIKGMVQIVSMRKV